TRRRLCCARGVRGCQPSGARLRSDGGPWHVRGGWATTSLRVAAVGRAGTRGGRAHPHWRPRLTRVEGFGGRGGPKWPGRRAVWPVAGEGGGRCRRRGLEPASSRAG